MEGLVGTILILVPVAIYFWLCALIGNGAKLRGRSKAGYFWLAFLLSPLIGFLAVMLLGPPKEAKE